MDPKSPASLLRHPLPPGIGEDAIRDGVIHALGSPLRRCQRVGGGVLNHVYYVWTESGATGVVRMQVRRERHFESECRAIRRCLSLELPVPEVLGLEFGTAIARHISLLSRFDAP